MRETMIVPDGRNDLEKLHELLVAGEQTHLDYKARIDWDSPRARLEFVKDVVAMSNLPGGGYILVGVEDGGTLSLPAQEVDRRRFDGAAMGQLVRSYVEGTVEVHPQIHELSGGMAVVSVMVEGHRDGLPVPMAKMGQYVDSETRNKTVFREGEVFVREGSTNVTLRHAHWPNLLVEHDRLVREQAQRDAQELIAVVVAQLREANSQRPTLAPLAVEMDEPVFADAVLTHLESSSGVRLTQFLVQARSIITSWQSDPERARLAVDRLAVAACQALIVGREGQARAALDAIRDAYDSLVAGDPGRAPVDALVVMVTRIYVIGAMAIRTKHWQLVNHLVLHPVEEFPGYSYASWLRHAQVEASRAERFPKDRPGLFISAARSCLAEHPAMRPDLLAPITPEDGTIGERDAALNSLCQFDLAYCLVVEAEGEGHAGGYPSCAAFHQSRSNPLYIEIASRSDVRRALFATATDENVATTMETVQDMAQRESWNLGQFWTDLPPQAQAYVDALKKGNKA